MNAPAFTLNLHDGKLTIYGARRLALHYGAEMPAMWATATLFTREDGISLCMTAAARRHHLTIEGPDGMLIHPTSRRLLDLFGIQTEDRSTSPQLKWADAIFGAAQ